MPYSPLDLLIPAWMKLIATSCMVKVIIVHHIGFLGEQTSPGKGLIKCRCAAGGEEVVRKWSLPTQYSVLVFSLSAPPSPSYSYLSRKCNFSASLSINKSR